MTPNPEITHSSFSRLSFRHDFPRVIVIALVYFFAHGIAFFFPDSEKVIMLIWPAGGIGLAAFLLNRRRLWPLLTLAFYFAGITADVFLAHRSFLTGVGYMTGNMVESIGCAWFIFYISRNFQNFTRVREVLALIVGTILINAFSACIGSGTSVLTRGASFVESWQSWYVADSLGILLVGPFIVSWITNIRTSITGLSSKKIIEALSFLLVWSIISYIVFYQPDKTLFWGFHPYMLVALLVYPAVRLGMRGITLSLVILFIIAIRNTEIINIPSPWGGIYIDIIGRLLALQIFLIFLAFVSYLISAFHSGLRRAEDLLRKSEVWYRTLIETAMDGFWLTDKKGRLLQVNDAYCRMSGYSRSELLNMQISDLEAIENADDIIAHNQKIISLGEDRFETSHRLKSGGLIDFEINVQYHQHDNGRFVVFLRDITDRKKAEESLLKSEALYLDLYENAPDMFFSVDSETAKIIQCNNTLVEKTNYTKEEIIGRSAFELYHPDCQENSKKAFVQFKKVGELKDIELQLRKKDGSSIDVILNATAVHKNGKIIYSRSVLRDITTSKKAEKEIKTILFTTMDGFYLVDMEGRILETNDSYCSMIGYSREELLKMKIKDIEAVDSEEDIKNRIQQILETGSARFETKHRRKDGSIIIVEASVNYLMEEQPKLICFMRDITRRIHDEVALRESEEKYRILSELSPEMIYLVDLNGHITYLNKAGAAQFRVNPSEIIGKHITDIFPSEIAHQHMAAIQKVIDTKSASYSEREMEFPFGNNWVSVRLSPVFDNEYQVVSVLGLSIDITEQKMAGYELLKLSRVVEQSPVSVVITNRNGDIEFVNQKLCVLTGYSKDELIGKNPRIWKSGYHDNSFYKEFWDSLIAGKNCVGEILNKKKNGELFWESVLIFPLINKDGETTNYVAIKDDITEKKNMISALIEAKNEAESASKLKDAFIANVSHEIRTPLNGVLGMTHLIKEMFRNSIRKEDEELFDGVDFSSKRIIRTVDMILNYSRLQVGEFNYKPNKINISHICTNLVTEFNTAAKFKSLELSFQNNCGDTTIFADENSITMAISDLIDNAIKFTNKGFISVILKKGIGNEIILEIKDTGVGINKEYLNNIFEPYRQEQMGYGRAYEGIGLGLAIVKKLLSMNKAVINVESEKGEGTTFTINFGKEELHRENKSETRAATNILTTSQEPGKEVILIVEDDLMNQITINKFIDNKYKTITTDSSDEALEILYKNKVDLILMDISIRGSKHGLELTKELKASKDFSHIPVIAVTAHAFEEDKQKALKAGCDSYLAKPFTKNSLLELIKVFVNKSI